jgi:hypothetical protein
VLPGQGELTDPPPDTGGSLPGPPARLLDLVGASLLYLVALGLLSVLTAPDVLSRLESDAQLFAGFQAADDAMLLLVAAAFARWRFPGSWAALGVRGVALRWWGIAAAWGTAAALLGWLTALAVESVGREAPRHPVEEVLESARGPADVLLVLLVVTLLVPVAEEAFFRGFAYQLLRARWGALAALAITSVGFALVHGLDPGAWLPVLPIGMILGGLAERSRSLLPPVVAHGVVNGLAIVAG